MKSLALLAAALLFAGPVAAAPLKTKAEAAETCATLNNGRGYQDAMACMEEQYFKPQERAREAAAARQAQWDAIPVGKGGTGVYVNGVEISKCSHGGLCLGQMVELMKRGY